MTDITRRVSTANAKAHLSALVTEVAFGGQRVIIERRGKPLAALVGLDDMMSKTERRSYSPGDARGALALVGAWRMLDQSEAAGIVADIRAQRDGGRDMIGDASGGHD